MDPVAWADLSRAPARGTASPTVLQRVIEARARQDARCGGEGALNALAPADRVVRLCRPDAAGARLLDEGVRRYGLSARTVHRTLRVARTIADLGARDTVGELDVAEALSLRVGSGSRDALSPVGPRD